jgi:CPA2 family monovalent cation:H+ antiporter-2
VFGLAVSVASTVVLLRVLTDNNDLHTPTGHIAVGWLIVEDLFTVLVLVLLPVVFAAGAGAGGIALALVWAEVKIGLLVGFVIVGGGKLLPWLLARVAATRSRELFTLAALVLALGIAVGAALLFGVSMALGAFLAGMVVGRSDFGGRAASEALPMRDAFAVLFFVSVGMLFNPAFLIEAPGLVAVTLVIILLGKPLAALVIVVLLRYPFRVALSVAAALAQIGEFSFILATLGRGLGVLPERATSALIAAAIVSISLNPILYRLTGVLEGRARRFPRLWRWLSVPPRIESQGPAAAETADRNRAVVVGYGPVGRTLVRLLRENEIEPTVIELNLDAVRRLRDDGQRAVYGDATHLETLKEARAQDAVAFILTSAGMHGSEEAIRLVRELNPRVRVFARCNYLREVPALRRHGADVVFAGEGEVALAMDEFLLRQLGASGEQIDRERARIRDELFGDRGAGEGEPISPQRTPRAQREEGESDRKVEGGKP